MVVSIMLLMHEVLLPFNLNTNPFSELTKKIKNFVYIDIYLLIEVIRNYLRIYKMNGFKRHFSMRNILHLKIFNSKEGANKKSFILKTIEE